LQDGGHEGPRHGARGLGVLGGCDVADEILQVDGDPAPPRVVDDGVAALETGGGTLFREAAAELGAELTGPAAGEPGKVVVGAVPVTERLETAENHCPRQYRNPSGGRRHFCT